MLSVVTSFFPLFAWALYLFSLRKDAKMIVQVADALMWVFLALSIFQLIQAVLHFQESVFLTVLLGSLTPLSVLSFFGLKYTQPKVKFGIVIPPFSLILFILAGILLSRNSLLMFLRKNESVTHLSILAGHILLIVVAYFIFTLAFLLALLYAVQDKFLKKKKFNRISSFLSQSSLSKKLIPFLLTGFIFYTLALIMGFLLSDGTALANFSLLTARIIIPLALWLIFAWISFRAVVLSYSGINCVRQTIVAYMLSLPVFILEIYFII